MRMTPSPLGIRCGSVRHVWSLDLDRVRGGRVSVYHRSHRAERPEVDLVGSARGQVPCLDVQREHRARGRKGRHHRGKGRRRVVAAAARLCARGAQGEGEGGYESPQQSVQTSHESLRADKGRVPADTDRATRVPAENLSNYLKLLNYPSRQNGSAVTRRGGREHRDRQLDAQLREAAQARTGSFATGNERERCVRQAARGRRSIGSGVRAISALARPRAARKPMGR